MGIIASILGILIFILIEVFPLFQSARVEPAGGFPTAGASLKGMVADEHRTHVAGLAADGTLRVHRTDEGSVVLRQDVVPEGSEAWLGAVAAAPGRPVLTGATRDGKVILVPVRWDISFDGDQRVVAPGTVDPIVLAMDPEGGALGAFAAQQDEEGSVTAVAQLADGTLSVVRRVLEEDFLSGEMTESFERATAAAPPRLGHLALDADGRNLFAGTADGRLLWWRLEDGVPGDPEIHQVGPEAISALTFLIGDRSLVVGDAGGGLSVWFPVRQEDQSFRLTRIRDFPPRPRGIRLLTPSPRDKGFFALDQGGGMGLYYSTSERVLWEGESPLEDVDALTYTPKADGAFLAAAGRVAALSVHNPHPEVSWKAFLGRVWYEGYSRPDYTWQSSSATDDFESKLSLIPLLVGTLKGTFYSLFLAIPLGVLGAMYTSQFLHPGLRRVVKPTVEIMAALPSVVLGFLAGLWLAPRLERMFPALVLMGLVLPALVLLAGYAWRKLPRAVQGRLPSGSETFLYVLVLLAGIWVCLESSGLLESALFGGDFQGWLLEATGLPYDQRNAVVVGLAMGFAVIPIIFAISEDAFSNVPQNLTSGSLALGATRWQTVTRVVLPTASPGIFSAIMVGFGRAVGETMIVLMATGNTPIMDWSPFNGFRTLSANIAVEIPEAPVGGTLYRTLFLAALLLFLLTFVVNTAAELIRQRLRRRYAEL
jgi:phosphate transport system permease protein